MHISQSAGLIAFVSAIAGVIHVMAPDHWLPASVLAWQRGWMLRKTALFSVAILCFHICLGLAIYFAIGVLVSHFGPDRGFAVALAITLGAMFLRMVRFSRIRGIFRSTNSNAVWGILGVLSLLGPCESLIPILLKSRQLGVGYLIPTGAFLATTLLVGSGGILAGRVLWNRPFFLPRGFEWTYRRRAFVPMVAGLIVALGTILH